MKIVNSTALDLSDQCFRQMCCRYAHNYLGMQNTFKNISLLDCAPCRVGSDLPSNSRSKETEKGNGPIPMAYIPCPQRSGPQQMTTR